MIRLMVTSKRAHTKDTSQDWWVGSHPHGEPLSTQTSAGDPPTLVCRSGSVSYGVTAPFLWVLVPTRFCLCPPRLECLVPPVLWKSCNQIPLAFKVRFHGHFQSLCPVPRLGSLTCGSESSQRWEIFFIIIVLQFVGHPPVSYWI